MQILPSKWLWILIPGFAAIMAILGYAVKIQPFSQSPPVLTPQPTPTTTPKSLINVSISVIDKKTLKSIPRVPYQIRKLSSAPIDDVTDDFGYFNVKIPDKKIISVYLNHECYKSQLITIDLNVDPYTTREIKLEPKAENCNNSNQSTTNVKPRNPNSQEREYPYKAKIRPDKEYFFEGEPISFRYEYINVPQKYSKWMTIVQPSISKDMRLERLPNLKDNEKAQFKAKEPGIYEIRACFNYNSTNFVCIAEHPITVKAVK